MIFITPYIIKSEFESAEMTNQKSGAQEKFREQYRIEKKDIKSDLPKVQPSQSHSTDADEESDDEAPLQTAPTVTTGDAAVKSAPSSTANNNKPGSALKSAPTSTRQQERQR